MAYFHAEPGQWFIYSLTCPLSGHVRYIGQTKQAPWKRLRQHLSQCHRHRNHCANWVRWLVRQGLEPLLFVIDKGHGDGCDEAERKWIAAFRQAGTPLTNIATGGHGGNRGLPCSPETKRKISEANRGRPKSAETLAKMRTAALGRKASEATRAKMRAAQANRPPMSEETKRKISEGHKRRTEPYPACSPESNRKRSESLTRHWQEVGRPPPTEEARRKMSESHRGKKMPEEQRAKISAALRGRPRSEETKRKISEGHRRRNAAKAIAEQPIPDQPQ